MHSRAVHRIFIALGVIALAFAGFLPLGYSIVYPHGENNFKEFIAKPAFGITHSVYYLNFILITVPLICGYHGRRLIARFLIVIFGVSAAIFTFIGCSFIGFYWAGPIHGSTGIGMPTLIGGDIALTIGCLLQVTYNRKVQEKESGEE